MNLVENQDIFRSLSVMGQRIRPLRIFLDKPIITSPQKMSSSLFQHNMARKTEKQQ